ncbi:MAG: hypothetical protein A2Y64_06230 [Candidatus Coatesbacteria bacterium RBG_13_66_14]|uniref:Outer membrane protein beta-barrel domain-containing protein n=1 Tax=Candidatus Coatesbacteria bacterium RBG_13_66_14 TaxID=1817816 RepID=A0A1F5EXE0_9BACT|nr:MAG: hypothetical protein A2Y64_06230 [Candidatus Coatesbacteria bacterium RBG_13_66_14]
MRKAVLVIVLLALALPASARVGAGMRLGFQDPSFCINLMGDFEITPNIDITADFDMILSYAFIGQFTGNFKYMFNLSGVNPYAGIGAGLVFGGGGVAFSLPFHVGMQLPLGANFYLDADVRPCLWIGEGTYFSFGFIAGVVYFF